MKLIIPWERVDPVIEGALKEDFGDSGDITTECIVPKTLMGKGEIITSENGIVAGLLVAERVFYLVDPNISCSFFVKDGMSTCKGMVIGEVRGKIVSILMAERTALNFLQRLSGIATLTAKFVKVLRGTNVKLLDTRKTTPQLRLLEKYAVRIGGGENHRFGLYDMVLIKDNHINVSGGVKPAVEKCLKNLKKKNNVLKVEIEVRTLEQVREAMQFPIQRIMLDNMNIEEIRQAVKEVAGQVELEASGNVSLETIRNIAETGVDFISAGSITHSAMSLDISLRVSL